MPTCYIDYIQKNLEKFPENPEFQLYICLICKQVFRFLAMPRSTHYIQGFQTDCSCLDPTLLNLSATFPKSKTVL